MTRRTILAALLAAPLCAEEPEDPAAEVWDVLTAIAAALVDANLGLFLRHFDSAMPGYRDLRAAVNGLILQSEVESTIEPVENTGDGRRRALEVDWTMHLLDRGDQHLTERRATVKCAFAKQGKHWKVVSFAPANFFAPPLPNVNFPHQR
jgi:hypothetical protein